jgi:hypothetical protein
MAHGENMAAVDFNLELPNQDGQIVSLAETLAGNEATLLLSYRGHW